MAAALGLCVVARFPDVAAATVNTNKHPVLPYYLLPVIYLGFPSTLLTDCECHIIANTTTTTILKMLSTRDQENLVHGHQQVAASKPLNQSTKSLQPKTPGNRYPKTPLKVPLHDENALTGFGGKTVRGKGLANLGGDKIGTTFDKDAFVTPMGRSTFLVIELLLTFTQGHGQGLLLE